MYDELKDMSYIFYINNTSGKLCTCSIKDKEELDDNGYPRYIKKYQDCIAALKDWKITDKLYLMKEETFNSVKKKFWQLDMYVIKDFFDHYADRAVGR